MCTGLEIAALVGAGASAVSAVSAMSNRPDKGPDPAALQAKADATAAQNANGRLTARKKALAANSLTAGGTDIMSSGILNGGKPTLGG